MASRRRWQLAVILAVIVLAMRQRTMAYYDAQFSNVTVYNQLGKRTMVQLSCYKLDITSRWFRAPKFKWIKIVENVRVEYGAGVSMWPCAKVMTATVATCTIVANDKGEECNWSVYNDDKNFEDKVGYDKAWYLRPTGIFDEVVDEAYKRPAEFRFRYCKEFSFQYLLRDRQREPLSR